MFLSLCDYFGDGSIPIHIYIYTENQLIGAVAVAAVTVANAFAVIVFVLCFFLLYCYAIFRDHKKTYDFFLSSILRGSSILLSTPY